MRKPSLMQRLRAKKQARQSVVGGTWYDEENWAKAKASAVDPDRFEGTYGEWQTMATKALADLRKAGVNVVPFNVNADELLAWCHAHNKPNNAASRAEFVSDRLRESSAPGS